MSTAPVGRGGGEEQGVSGWGRQIREEMNGSWQQQLAPGSYYCSLSLSLTSSDLTSLQNSWYRSIGEAEPYSDVRT